VSHEEDRLHAVRMYTHPFMIHTDRTFSEAVRSAVAQAERGTSAELIVVVAARSGSYLDVAGAFGAAVAALALLAALFAPVAFRPAAVAVEIPLAFGVATWLAHRIPGVLRALVPAARARGQVERAAASHFLSEAVHGTRGRTGLLVYVSLLERRVALVPDLGLTGRVPSVLWTGVRWRTAGDPARPRTQDDLVRGIGEIGSILRAHLPADGADVNESPDAPRIVP
jgi:putative membrane protein